jgi:sugar phosphate isomerase/epimerase
MKRDYGICLWTFGNVPFEEKCRLASEVGVNGVEVEGDISQDPREILTTLSKYDFENPVYYAKQCRYLK